MKNFTLLLLLAIALTGCGQSAKKAESATKQIATATDANVVNVYYFHGKQRCKTCIAIENIVRETTSSVFPDNPNVKYIKVDITQSQNEALVKKYEAGWNKLIVAKGDDMTDLTEHAFANAVSNPALLQIDLVYEIDKRLQ